MLRSSERLNKATGLEGRKRKRNRTKLRRDLKKVNIQKKGKGKERKEGRRSAVAPLQAGRIWALCLKFLFDWVCRECIDDAVWQAWPVQWRSQMTRPARGTVQYGTRFNDRTYCSDLAVTRRSWRILIRFVSVIRRAKFLGIAYGTIVSNTLKHRRQKSTSRGDYEINPWPA